MAVDPKAIIPHLTDEADDVIAARMSVPVKVAEKDVIQKKDFLYYLYGGIYPRILAAQGDTDNPVKAGTAISAIAYLNNPDFTTIVWSDPLFQGMLAAFVGYGVATQEEVDAAKKALCETWAAPVPGATAEDVALARLWKKWQGLVAEVDRVVSVMSPDITGSALPATVLSGGTTQQVATWRAAMLAAVASAKASLEAGATVDFPASAAELFAQVKA